MNEIIERCSNLKSRSHDAILLKLTQEANKLKKLPRIPNHLPTKHTTLYKLFKDCVDLYAFPKKAFLWALVNFNCLTDDTERRFLTILASKEGSTYYTSEILQKHITFYDLLKLCHSWNFNHENIGILFEHLPRLMPRPYSISSSLLAANTLPESNHESTVLKIIFSLNNPPGITTHMLQQLIFAYQQKNSIDQQSFVDLYFRKSNNFRITDEDLDWPLIMIAIGTGVAPFIGFLEHIQKQHQQKHSVHRFTWLIFGCRRKDKQLCNDRIHEFIADGTLSKFSECFSRDSDINAPKYVQDIIRANSEEFIQRFMDDTNENDFSKVFVCGSRKMATDVRSAIKDSLIESGRCSTTEDSDVIVNEFIKNSRYIEDIWV